MPGMLLVKLVDDIVAPEHIAATGLNVGITLALTLIVCEKVATQFSASVTCNVITKFPNVE